MSSDTPVPENDPTIAAPSIEDTNVEMHATIDAIDKSEGNAPAVTCVVCGQSRGVCKTPGDFECQVKACTTETQFKTIQRLAHEVESWAGTAHQIFAALEAAYTGKTLCGWCRTPLQPGEGPQHSFVCVKNPVTARLRALTDGIRALYNDMPNINHGDIAYALEALLGQEAEKTDA